MLDTIRWQILLVALAGWVNRRQLEVIAYLREENRVLNEHLGGAAEVVGCGRAGGERREGARGFDHPWRSGKAGGG